MRMKDSHFYLTLLKHSSHNANHLAQILAQTITTALINKTLIWNYILRSYSKSSTPIKAIHIYNYYIKANSLLPDHHTYPCLLKTCSHLSSLPKGRELHAHVTKTGLNLDPYISNSLIHFYGSTGQVHDARHCFDEMFVRDLVSWNSVMAVYSASPELRHEALVLFKDMLVCGVEADEITLVSLLSACSQLGGVLEYGRGIHGYVIKVGFRCGVNVRNALLSVYTYGGNMDAAYRLFREGAGGRDVVSETIMINGFVEVGLVDEARETFDMMVVKDRFAWNSMINGYVKVKRPKEALKLFEEMDKDMVSPDEDTVVSVLSACASLSELQLGRLVHGYILQRGIKQDVVVGTALVNMYAKCGSVEEAMITFYQMDYKDVFAWTAAITGLAEYGRGKEVLALFKKMENELVRPNEATFVSVLMACSRSGLVEEGCLLLDRMVGVYKIQPTVEHLGCLIDILSRSGLLFRAEEFIEGMPPEGKLLGYKTLLSATMKYSDIDLGERLAQKLIELKPSCHGVYILVSNFFALAGRWDKVMVMREIMKDMNMKKEVGISIVEAGN